MTTLSVERVNEALSYDPETGLLRWKYRTRNGTVNAGDVAGYSGQRGYLQITLDRETRAAHRLAWAIATGAFPVGVIDHINGIKTDNRLCNLRDVSKSENQHNKKRAQRNNRSGLLGVSTYKTHWAASIKASGKIVRLGNFNSPEAAHEAYLQAKRQLHKGNTL